MRRLSYLATFSVIALLMFVPSTGAQQQPQSVTVSIQNFAFNPPNITVPPGSTVTWVNNDMAPHTTTSDNGVWDSETLQPGRSFSFTFKTPGTFMYHCEIHPFMMGSVTVRSGGGLARPTAARATAGGTTAIAGGGGPTRATAGGTTAVAGGS